MLRIIIILLTANVYWVNPLMAFDEHGGQENQRVEPIKDQSLSAQLDPSLRLERMLDQSWNIRNAQPEKSLELGLQAIALADSLEDYYNLVKAHSFTGVAYRVLGDYNKAIEIFFKGLELAQKHDIPQQEGYAYINIANLHIYLEFFSQALENLRPALEIAQQINDQSMLSYIYLNKGRVLMHIDSADHALENISKALEIRKATGNIPGQAVCYKYLGDIYFNRDDFDNARRNYDLALSTVDRTADRDLLGNIQLQQSRIFCQIDDYISAEPFAREALSIGREVSSRLLIHDAMKVLAKVNMNKQDYQAAAQDLITMTQYADTLFSQQLSEKMLGMEFQLERQQQQAQLDIITRDKEIQMLTLSRQQYLNTALIAFALMLALIGAVLLILLRKLKQKNQQLLEQKEELRQINAAKDRMFMVIGHDLRSPVWNLRALIELLKEEQVIDENVELKDNFRALSRAVQSVSDLLENLLFWARSQDGKIVFKPAPTDLKYLVIKSIQPYKSWAEAKNVQIDFQADEAACMVNVDENMLQTVVRNFISNAIKYSYENGIIKISVVKEENYSRFSVTDNGKGINPEHLKTIQSNELLSSSKGTGDEPGSGIGLSLCKDFIARHNARLMVASSAKSGTTFYFDLPILPRPW